MKRFSLAGLLIVAVSASLLEEQGAQFQAFKLKHDKSYINQAEETKRFTIFKNNLDKIASHNARYEQGLESYTLGVNQFADMTALEFASMLGTQRLTKPNLNITEAFEMPEGVQAPTSIDWREHNAVTPVKNQGTCGGCWAFSLTGSIEGARARKDGVLISLSEQQLIDCSTNINYGCEGGYLEDTFPYIIQYGLESEGVYPFIGYDSTCNYQSSRVVTTVSSYVTVYDNESRLKDAVGTVGPVSVAINANDLQLYNYGIFHDATCSQGALNHGVLIVGYGTASGVDYWTVKNSWGRSWGENGYFRFRFGVNECGITEDTVYPII